MKNKRIKKILVTLATRDDAEAVMNELAQTVNNQRKVLAQRDAEILAINKKYEAGLGAYDEAITEKRDALHAWADANPAEFAKGRKSLDLVSGTIGFRTGTPKLALLNRAWTWDKILAVICATAPEWTRTKVEVAKDTILSAYSEGAVDDTSLATKGIKVVQDETFFADPNLADTTARQTAEAA